MAWLSDYIRLKKLRVEDEIGWRSYTELKNGTKSNLVKRNNFHLRSLFALEYITNKTIGLLNVIKLCISDSAIPIS